MTRLCIILILLSAAMGAAWQMLGPACEAVKQLMMELLKVFLSMMVGFMFLVPFMPFFILGLLAAIFMIPVIHYWKYLRP